MESARRLYRRPADHHRRIRRRPSDRSTLRPRRHELHRHRRCRTMRPAPWSSSQRPSSSRSSSSVPVVPPAAPVGEDPRDRPSAGRGRPARPRRTTNGSSPPSRGTGRGQVPLCWSSRARERARRRGSSSATAVTALPSLSYVLTRTCDPLSSHITAPAPPSPVRASARTPGARPGRIPTSANPPSPERLARTPCAVSPSRNRPARPGTTTLPDRATSVRSPASRLPTDPLEPASP